MKKLKPLKVYDPESVMSSEEMKKILGGGYGDKGYLLCTCQCIYSIGVWQEYTSSGYCPHPINKRFMSDNCGPGSSGSTETPGLAICQ